MARNLIHGYGKQRCNITVQVIDKEKYIYYQIENGFHKEKKEYHNYAVYKTEDIPNNFKFWNSPKRNMYITIIASRQAARLLDLFPEIKKEDNTANMLIHCVNKPFLVFISGAEGPIHLDKCTTLEIINGDGRETKISFQSEKEATMIVVEILFLAKPRVIFSTNEPLWTYNVNTNDMKTLKSFIRVPLSSNQENRLTNFVAAHYCTLKDNLTPALVAVTILNYDGELVVNSIITPRQNVKHYQSHTHKLTEEQIRGNWDGEEAKNEICRRLDGRIIVGIMMADFLDTINFPYSRILGIRDLGGAKHFEKQGFQRCKGAFRIAYLQKQILTQEDIMPKTDLQSEMDAHLIRKIYLKIRDQWEDHITSTGRNNIPQSQANKINQTQPKKPIYKLIPLSPVINQDDELGPPPMVTFHDMEIEDTPDEPNSEEHDSYSLFAEIPVETEVSRNLNQDTLKITITNEEPMNNQRVVKNTQQTMKVLEISQTSSNKNIQQLVPVDLDDDPEPEEEIPEEIQDELSRETNEEMIILSDTESEGNPKLENRLQRPGPSWKNKLDKYDGKRVAHTALFNQNIRKKFKYINGEKFILSSMVWENTKTGDPFVVSFDLPSIKRSGKRPHVIPNPDKLTQVPPSKPKQKKKHFFSSPSTSKQ